MNNLVKDKVIEANAAYRAGNPVLSDQEYDDLLESLKPTMSEDEYEEFISSLNEGVVERNVDGKVKWNVWSPQIRKGQSLLWQEIYASWE